MTEAELLRLEAEIPELARAASRAAFAALEVGSVIVFEDDALVEVFRDGTRVRLKSMPPQQHVPPGTTARLDLRVESR